MIRASVIGFLFLVVGLVLIGLGAAPAVLGILATPHVRGDVDLTVLGIGIFLAIFGAWLVPSSGAGVAFSQIVLASGPLLDRVPGLSRVGDPKPPTGGPS
jgi:hypothetical protein